MFIIAYQYVNTYRVLIARETRVEPLKSACERVNNKISAHRRVTIEDEVTSWIRKHPEEPLPL